AVRERLVGVVVVVQGQADLLQVVLALGPHGGVADLLDGRQEQADQDGDDRDDDEQLDQREATPVTETDHDASSKTGTTTTTSRPARAENHWRKPSGAHGGRPGGGVAVGEARAAPQPR